MVRNVIQIPTRFFLRRYEHFIDRDRSLHSALQVSLACVSALSPLMPSAAENRYIQSTHSSKSAASSQASSSSSISDRTSWWAAETFVSSDTAEGSVAT